MGSVGRRLWIIILLPLLPLMALAVYYLLAPASAVSDGGAPGASSAATPAEPQTPLDEARAALMRGDAIAAEILLKRIVGDGGKKEDIAAYMGEALIMRGELLAARQWLESGDFSKETRGHGYRMLGWLEMLEGNLGNAGAAYDNALESLPKDGDLWVDIGRFRYLGGEQIQAIEAIDYALELEPDNVRALEFKGQLQRDSAGLHAALPYFKRALKQAPDNLAILGEYAATLGELGRAKEMLAITRRMIKLDDSNAQAFFLQAVLAARAGETDLARRLLWRTKDAYKSVPAAMLLQGVLELQAGNHETAIEVLERLLRRQPDNVRLDILVAHALAEGGAWHELAARYTPLAERKDASPYLLTLVGRAYENLDQRGEAARFLDRAALPYKPVMAARPAGTDTNVLAARWSSDPAIISNTIEYVRARLTEGGVQEAAVLAQNLLAEHEASSDIQLLAGDARFLANDLPGALVLYQKIARIRFSPNLLLRMMMANNALGHKSAAEAALHQQTTEHPLNADFAMIQAENALAAQDWAQAEKFYRKVLALSGHRRDPDALAGFALTLLQTGDVEQAQALAREAYLLQPMRWRPTWALGHAMQAQNQQSPQARALLAKAAKLGAGRMPAAY